jgi:UDP-3-O-[3-hydroxymyristoyl] glucosamine N-acyltransferase
MQFTAPETHQDAFTTHHTAAHITGDSRFYNHRGPFSVNDVAAAVGGSTLGSERQISGLAPLNAAGATDLSFINNRRYLPSLGTTDACAVIVTKALAHAVPAGIDAIICADPDAAWAVASALFYPRQLTAPGVHATANVAAGATVHPSAEVGPFACVESGAYIGPNCRIGAYSYIGHGVQLGADCFISTHVSINYAVLGARVRIFSGVRIGEDGFGFTATPNGFVSAPQLGRVILCDDVEIGANSTIDRGSVADTIIGAGSRIDNLVQIGHNVRLGKCCVIVAQVGIAGSTVLEDFVQIGGQAALASHLHVGTGAQIGAQAGLISNAPAHAVLLGSPAQPRQEFFRQIAMLKRFGRRRLPDAPAETGTSA